jgi:hypothetical protein
MSAGDWNDPATKAMLHPKPPATLEPVTALAEAAATRSEAECAASRLIDLWGNLHGRPVPWAKAVGIVAILQHLDDAERDRLLALDDEDPT